MKYFLLMAFVWPFIAASQNTKVDEKNGFKDLHFEDNLQYKLVTIKNSIITTDSILSVFNITDTRYLQVGECLLSSVRVTGFRNKIYSITITTKNITDSKCLFDALSSLFGLPKQDNEFMEQYRWTGTKCNVEYKENSITGAADVTMMSLKLASEFEKYTDAIASKTAKDL